MVNIRKVKITIRTNKWFCIFQVLIDWLYWMSKPNSEKTGKIWPFYSGTLSQRSTSVVENQVQFVVSWCCLQNRSALELICKQIQLLAKAGEHHFALFFKHRGNMWLPKWSLLCYRQQSRSKQTAWIWVKTWHPAIQRSELHPESLLLIVIITFELAIFLAYYWFLNFYYFYSSFTPDLQTAYRYSGDWDDH